jgi:hypothetical protein
MEIDLGYCSLVEINESGWKNYPEFHEDYNLDPDEKVIDLTTIRIKYTYPLSNSVTYRVSSRNGFTRKQLAKIIARRYQMIYDEEEATSDVAVENIPNMLNRCQTTGRFGIWGHCIDDLILHTAHIDGDLITLGLDS